MSTRIFFALMAFAALSDLIQSDTSKIGRWKEKAENGAHAVKLDRVAAGVVFALAIWQFWLAMQR